MYFSFGRRPSTNPDHTLPEALPGILIVLSSEGNPVALIQKDISMPATAKALWLVNDTIARQLQGDLAERLGATPGDDHTEPRTEETDA